MCHSLGARLGPIIEQKLTNHFRNVKSVGMTGFQAQCQHQVYLSAKFANLE